MNEAILCNTLLRQEQFGELMNFLKAENRSAGVSAVLEVVQRQLQDLASEFSSFKRTEAQHFPGLKPAAGGATQVFNVSYPPFVIPLVNVHESRESSDKTISISGTSVFGFFPVP